MTGSARPLPLSEIVAFVGPLGTGKTEIAINYALAASGEGRRVCLLDFDIVTPYFRLGDCRGELEGRGLRVIAPEGTLAVFENPALSPEIAGALQDAGCSVVLDVGGDPVGARLLRAFQPPISLRPHELWLVLNPHRLGSGAASLEQQRQAIEDAAGLPISGLVANPHLGPLTGPDQIHGGLRAAEEASQRLALPLVFVAVSETLVHEVPPPAYPMLPLHRFLRLPWETM